MLTKNQYEDLWLHQFYMNIPLLGIVPPNYHEYVLREVQFQDYLNLFNSDPLLTYQRVVNPTYPEHGPVYLLRNEEYYLVGNYPWPGMEGSIKAPIKYILIAESSRESAAATYVYNSNHTKFTHYFSAIVSAFGIGGDNKNDRLYQMACKGILLIDIFPFSIDYSRLRKILNNKGVTKYFWDSKTNPYSINNRLNEIALRYRLDEKWDLSLMAPYLLSDYILDPKNGLHPLVLSIPGVHPFTFRKSLSYTHSASRSKLLKLCISTAGFPHATLIKYSFNHKN